MKDYMHNEYSIGDKCLFIKEPYPQGEAQLDQGEVVGFSPPDAAAECVLVRWDHDSEAFFRASNTIKVPSLPPIPSAS